MKRAVRKIHRWLGLLLLAQLLAWTLSGFYFTLHPIEEIRGEHLTRDPETIAPTDLGAAGPLNSIRDALNEELGADWQLGSLGLQVIANRAVWRAEGRADGETFRRLLRLDGTEVLPGLSAEAAGKRAAAWLRSPSNPVLVDWVEPGTGGHDLRGRDGPAWKVSFEQPEEVDLYLDPWTGEILARRTDRWRLFDFMWMLHIMDYDAREDFHHPLIQVSAVASVLVALSGLLVWLLTRRALSAGASARRSAP